jgi:putative Mn2+ efflux pump MntP
LSLGELLLVAFAVSLDNLAATLALGTRTPRAKRLVVAAIFAGWGGLLPGVGILLGRGLAPALQLWSAVIGGGALVLLGLWAIVGGYRHRDEPEPRRAIRSIPGLALLGLTLAVDNLVVGFGVGLRGADPLGLSAAAAVMVFVSSYSGLVIGRAGSRRWGSAAEIAAGVLLVGIGAAMATGWM